MMGRPTPDTVCGLVVGVPGVSMHPRYTRLSPAFKTRPQPSLATRPGSGPSSHPISEGRQALRLDTTVALGTYASFAASSIVRAS